MISPIMLMKIIRQLSLSVVVIVYSQSIMASNSIANLTVSVNVASSPCKVATGDKGENVVVDFGTIAEKTFYSTPHRSSLQPFKITLSNCDLSLGKTVKIMFTGNEDKEQQGLFSINSTDVKHIAIGLQSSDGNVLEVNKKTQEFTLNTGETVLEFKAYLQASKQGIISKGIGFGQFSAESIFQLEYP